jgi:hypothetical protein
VHDNKGMPMLLNRLVLLILLLIAVVCLFFWVRFDGEVSSLGLNGFTETLGILVTVLIVDQLIKRQEELRSLPQRATAYEDVRLLTSRAISFWANVYRSCVPEESPESPTALFTKESFEKMGRYLNMDSNANVEPKKTWLLYLSDYLAEQKKSAETILERHNNVLHPEAYRYVHYIATEGFDTRVIINLRRHVPKPHILAYYWYLPEGYCEAIVGLAAWCEQQMKVLDTKGIKQLRHIAKIGKWERQTTPRCMMSDAELAKQIASLKTAAK